MPPDRSSAPLVLVFGMHRSGTSALTRAIALGGVALPRTLLEPRSDNEGGYWESARLVALNALFLRSIGAHCLAAWTPTLERASFDAQAGFARQLERAYLRECPSDAPAVIKDPRMCLVPHAHLSAAAAVGRRVVAVLLVRDPEATAQSLAARNGVNRTYAGLLWRQHVLIAERATRELPRLILCHDDLLRDPVETVERIYAAAGLGRPRATDAIRAWIRPERVRWRRGGGTGDAASAALLREMAAGATDRAWLGACHDRMVEAGTTADPGCPTDWLVLQSEVTIAQAQLAALAAERLGCEQDPGTIDGALRALDLRLDHGVHVERQHRQVARGPA